MSEFKTKAKVLYDYQAQTSAELSIEEGQHIHLSTFVPGEEWWLAENSNGSRGYVPANFVRILQSESNEEEQAMIPQQSIDVVMSGMMIAYYA